ncbi:hypothetical protein DFH27DRAFT_104294 [Peziza echinospora]|nr:hypothetical protein DFH27DRAFT_104294 [Peziza echinospora]
MNPCYGHGVTTGGQRNRRKDWVKPFFLLKRTLATCTHAPIFSTRAISVFVHTILLSSAPFDALGLFVLSVCFFLLSEGVTLVYQFQFLEWRRIRKWMLDASNGVY